ncbi:MULTISPECIES: MFS transporter [unclassified Nocardiopsis]|uniref:MFS transporter n=1 Tax=unclassified Nocardiopsis TaxID=2649073 RepID=UPI00135832F7|nr:MULTISPECIES: MFS transporter [unclassified Nocardiopsis]
MSPDEAKSAPAASAGGRRWLGLAVLALPTLLLSLDFTVLHLALPHLAADLAPTSAQQLWILDVYGFMIAGFLVTMGTLGDRIGRRRLLMIGAAAFGAASLFAAYSTSAGMLIAARALLGVAGATLMPSTLSLISNMFHDPRQRGLAVAVWMSCFSAGGAIGPMVGGVLLQWFWWGSVFLMGVPVMALLLVAAPFLLPEFRDPAPGRLDPVSVALSLAAVLPVVYAVKEAAENGWGPGVAAPLLTGAVFGWLFVRRQRRLENPLVDLALFRLPPFTVGLGGLLAGTVVLGAFVLLFAQYLQLVLELSPSAAGLWMVPYALGNIAGAMLAPLVAARLRAATTIALGLVVSAAGLVVFVQSGADSGPLPAVVGSVLVTFGLGPLMVLVVDLVIASAPREKSGSASSLSETCSEVGMALGVATLGALGTAVYRSRISEAVLPGVPSGRTEAARDGLPGAVATARDMEPALAAQVTAAAERAFMAGLTAVGYTGAAVVLGVAAVTFLFLRDVAKPAGEERDERREERPRTD